MTRKDFELIALVFKSACINSPGKQPPEVVYLMALDMADKCASTNANFDQQRFLKACGVWD